jgi:hypothetical protein
MRPFDLRKSARSLQPRQGVLIRALVRFVLLCSFNAILLTIYMERLVFPLQLPCLKMILSACRALVASNDSRGNSLINFETFSIQRLARSLPCSLVVVIADQLLTESLPKPLPKPISSKPGSPTPSKMRTHRTLTRHSSTNPIHQNSSVGPDIIRVRLVSLPHILSLRAGLAFGITTMQWRSEG